MKTRKIDHNLPIRWSPLKKPSPSHPQTQYKMNNEKLKEIVTVHTCVRIFSGLM
ncbi:MAG: hypothetical protein KAJ52_03250 [Sedimentisphaerales bacterium]|nr:hypothetical protein [Sedimentisphaerales bacterium]